MKNPLRRFFTSIYLLRIRMIYTRVIHASDKFCMLLDNYLVLWYRRSVRRIPLYLNRLRAIRA